MSAADAGNIGVDEPPGIQNFSSRPSSMPPAISIISLTVVPSATS